MTRVEALARVPARGKRPLVVVLLQSTRTGTGRPSRATAHAGRDPRPCDKLLAPFEKSCRMFTARACDLRSVALCVVVLGAVPNPFLESFLTVACPWRCGRLHSRFERWQQLVKAVSGAQLLTRSWGSPQHSPSAAPPPHLQST